MFEPSSDPRVTEFRSRAKWDAIPEHCRHGLDGYISFGWHPGHFLTAVLANDLSGAVGRADLENSDAIPGYARFLYNYAPSQCHGSYEKVEAWVSRGGLAGRQEQEVDHGTDS